MHSQPGPIIASDLDSSISRRATVRRLIVGGGAAVLAGRDLSPTTDAGDT
jgi:hypothetical protein